MKFPKLAWRAPRHIGRRDNSHCLVGIFEKLCLTRIGHEVEYEAVRIWDGFGIYSSSYHDAGLDQVEKLSSRYDRKWVIDVTTTFGGGLFGLRFAGHCRQGLGGITCSSLFGCDFRRPG